MPAVGGLFTGFILFRLFSFKGAHSIPAILQAVASGKNYFKGSMALPPSLAVVTIATGGSCGPEGPIAEIGSVMGSQIGRLAGIPPRLVKPLIGSGVAAGIAAVFNAPIGGVFFAMEVILRHFDVGNFTPIVIAAVVASVISQAAPGGGSVIAFPDAMNIPLHELWLFALLGLLCGLISIAMIHGLGFSHDFFRNRVKLPIWLRPAFGGLIVGVIGLFLPQVMGEGYEWIRHVIAADGPHTRTLGLLLALVVFKIVATGATLGSGTPGGSFAPSVFIGVMGGAAFGIVAQKLGFAADAAPYAAIGMAGLIAGALGAPITAIMITLQYSPNQADLLLPVMTTVALSMLVMQLNRNLSVYTLEFLRLGIDLDRARTVDPLSLVRVSAVTHTEVTPSLPADMPVSEALGRIKDSAERWFVVRGEHDLFIGIISLHEMRMAIADEELAQLLVLSDITDSFVPRLHLEMSLKEALKSFQDSDAEVLPVFNGPEKEAVFVGVVSRQDALNAYSESTHLAY